MGGNMLGDILKKKVIVKITTFEKNKESMSIKNKQYLNWNRKEILSSIGNRTYEVVDKEPDKFQFGVFYVLRDGKRAYIFDLDES